MAGFFTSTGWLIAGFALLTAEVLLPGVYLLFFGVGALAIGANLLFFPGLGWTSQLIGFAAVSAVALMAGYRWYGNRPEPAGASLNRRTERLVGRHAILSEAIVNGRGRVQLDDGWWSVEGPDLPAGTPVIIRSANGSVLMVEGVSG